MLPRYSWRYFKWSSFITPRSVCRWRITTSLIYLLMEVSQVKLPEMSSSETVWNVMIFGNGIDSNSDTDMVGTGVEYWNINDRSCWVKNGIAWWYKTMICSFVPMKNCTFYFVIVPALHRGRALSKSEHFSGRLCLKKCLCDLLYDDWHSSWRRLFWLADILTFDLTFISCFDIPGATT